MLTTNSLSFDKIRRESVTQKVYEVLRSRILTGELAPGTHLVETAIAERIGTSRGPVREAIRQLEADGLVVIKTNIGTFVHTPSVTEIKEIYTIRMLLESYAAQLAAERATPESIQALKQIMEAVSESAQRGDTHDTVRLDFALHRQIWEMASHQILYDSLSRLEGRVRTFIALQAPLFEKLVDSIADHLEIIDAIASGNGEAASNLTREHIMNAGQLILSHIDHEEGYALDEMWPHESSDPGTETE